MSKEISKEINKELKALSKMKKANKLVQLYFHEKGPRSYKRGVGALLSTLAKTKKGEETQRELSAALGLSRKDLKSVVKKAQRKGFVTIEDANKKKTYIVKLTPEGEKVANKRDDAQQKAASTISQALSVEELAALEEICDKLIVAIKEEGISGKKKGRKFHKKHKKCHLEECGHREYAHGGCGHHSHHSHHGHGYGHGNGHGPSHMHAYYRCEPLSHRGPHFHDEHSCAPSAEFGRGGHGYGHGHGHRHGHGYNPELAFGHPHRGPRGDRYMAEHCPQFC